jgi:hypothetical protein
MYRRVDVFRKARGASYFEGLKTSFARFDIGTAPIWIEIASSRLSGLISDLFDSDSDCRDDLNGSFVEFGGELLLELGEFQFRFARQ